MNIFSHFWWLRFYAPGESAVQLLISPGCIHTDVPDFSGHGFNSMVYSHSHDIGNGGHIMPARQSAIWIKAAIDCSINIVLAFINKAPLGPANPS
jgi:hypothetical protein